MSDTAKTITREELYKQVWRIPTLELAKQFGVSDVAIAKACKRLNVPKPPVGYWAKLEAGKRVKRAKLPPINAGELSAWVFDPSVNATVNPSVQEIELPFDLNGCHPLIENTQKLAEAKMPDADGIVRFDEQSTLRIFVSEKSLPRALRIMQAVIAHCIQSGWFLDNNSRLAMHGHTVRLSLSEKTERKNPKDATETPTGRLHLKVEYYLYSHAFPKGSVDRNWSDGELRRLERVLSGVTDVFDEAAERFLAHAMERSEPVRQWAARERWEAAKRRRREHEEQCVTNEKLRRERLAASVEGWFKAERLRSLCSEVEARAATQPDFGALTLDEWMHWARTLAKNIDPFENGYFAEAAKYEGLDSTGNWR